MPLNKSPLFAKSNKKEASADAEKVALMPWKVLIVDDEPEVHTVTTMVLKDFELKGRSIQIIDAYSGAEAREILQQEGGFALCLIDVVMESDDAGLELVRYIRQDLKDLAVRLVLRTGQPGYAPEKDVIRDYDINDYKDKTELTDIKLHTLMCSAFRAYDDILSLELNRLGLEMVIKATADIFEATSLHKFTSAVLMQLMSLLNLSKDAMMLSVSGFSATEDNKEFEVLAGVGKFDSLIGKNRKDHLPHDEKLLVSKSLAEGGNIYEKDRFVLHSKTDQGNHHLLYIQHNRELTDLDRRLVELFCHNISIAYENHTLRKEIEDTQREIVCILSESIENRSKESGNHIYRVAEMTAVMAKAFGYSDEETARIKAAAPLHDVGKVAIPDAVLHKPGKLDGEEWDVMKTHVDVGYDMLKGSKRKILEYASIIAHEHHERWDGEGYPEKIAGEDIHILGRIVSLVDVFDALTSKRCYKEAWPLDKALDLIKSESGKQFDPHVVDVFIENIDSFLRIKNEFTDQ